MFAADGAVCHARAAAGGATVGTHRLRGAALDAGSSTELGDEGLARQAWTCLAGEMLYDRRSSLWARFLVFVAPSAGEQGRSQIGIGWLGADGAWSGMEVVQDLPLAADGARVELSLGDGPIVCLHDLGDEPARGGSLLVLAPGADGVWQSCMAALPAAEGGGRQHSVLCCGPLPAGEAPAATDHADRATGVLLAESSAEGESLRWLLVGKGAAGKIALAAPQPAVRLPPTYCTAPCRCACWLQSEASACLVGLENGRVLKLGGSGGEARRLLTARDVGASAEPEPVLHVRTALFGGEAGGAAVVAVVAQQRSAVHLLDSSSLAVLKTVPTVTAEGVHCAVLVDRFGKGCAAGVDELLVLEPVGGSTNEGLGQWSIRSARALAFGRQAEERAPRLVARHGLSWRQDGDDDAMQTEQAAEVPDEDGEGEAAAAAIEAFSGSLERRLQAAQDSLHRKQRELVEKRSLARYTQRMLSEMATAAAAHCAAPTAGGQAEGNEAIANAGLQEILGGGSASAEDSELAGGFVAPAFAGLVPPRASAAHGHVEVIDVAQQPVCAPGGSLDLCLTISLRNTGAGCARKLSAAVLPWCPDASTSQLAASPPALPSVCTALEVLVGSFLRAVSFAQTAVLSALCCLQQSEERGSLQVVVRVLELLSLSEAAQARGAARLRGTIGAPSPPPPLPLYLLVTWLQDPAEGTQAGSGKGDARGLVHGPLSVDAALLLQPRGSVPAGHDDSQPEETEQSPPEAMAPPTARNVGLEHISLLLVPHSESAQAHSEAVDVAHLAELIAAHSGLAASRAAGGVLLRPSQTGSGRGGLSGVTSAFLSPCAAEMAPTVADETDAADGGGGGAAGLKAHLVSCQLWCEASTSAVALQQLSLLLPAGVTMLPPVALLPPPLPTAQDAALPRGTTVLDAQEELVDALAAELETITSAPQADASGADAWQQQQARRNAAIASNLAAANLLTAAGTVWPEPG